MKSFFAALVIVVSSACTMTGCANRALSSLSVRAFISPMELEGDIVLEGCKPNSYPLNCKTASFTCKQAGCGRLQVVKHARTGDNRQRNSALSGSN